MCSANDASSAAETETAARIVSEAERVFQDKPKAALWLRRTNMTLGRQAPLALLATGAGAKAVQDALIRIDHGMFG